MASIIFSGIGVTAARGKVGSRVFTATRAGNITRAYVIPANTVTAPKTAIQNYMLDANSLWAGLSPEEIIQWELFASRLYRFNKVRHKFRPTGRNVFIQSTINLLASLNLPINVPSFSAISYQVKRLSFLNATTVTIKISPFQVNETTLVPDDNYLVISFSPCVSTGINYPKNFFRIAIVIPPTTDVTAIDLISEYTALFGAPVVGKKIFCRVWQVNALSGLKSTPVTSSTIVI